MGSFWVLQMVLHDRNKQKQNRKDTDEAEPRTDSTAYTYWQQQRAWKNLALVTVFGRETARQTEQRSRRNDQ